MKVICVTRLFGLLCGITTMNSLTNKFNNKLTIDTISKITNTKSDDLPHYDTINDVFDYLDIDELRKIQKYNEHKFNIIRFIEQVKNKDDKIFTFITSLSVIDNNIKRLIDMGRKRFYLILLICVLLIILSFTLLCIHC